MRIAPHVRRLHRMAARIFGCLPVFVWALSASATGERAATPTSAPPPFSPVALAVTADGQTLMVACRTAHQLLFLDAANPRVIRTVGLPGAPSGMALSRDDRRLYLTCSEPDSRWCEVDVASGKLIRSTRASHSASSPTLSADGRTLWLCHRFLDSVASIDLVTRRETRRIRVSREPVSIALSPDERHLLVANHLPAGPADTPPVAAVVDVIDTATGTLLRPITLPNGSTTLRDIRISPDGRYACVPHILARYFVPTTQLDRGWMNNNALSWIDLSSLRLLGTVLLDNIDRGAANPWALTWTADGSRLTVSHAGTHEVSLLDTAALLAKLGAASSVRPPGNPSGPPDAVAPEDDLAFLVGIRHRVRLRGNGPRALALAGDRLIAAGYFSDTLEFLDPTAPAAQPQLVDLHEIANTSPHRPGTALSQEETARRHGEQLFNDASICFQGWQSCASCHSDDARVDGLNWDLLNDGIGNPKNTKSLLLSHRTPPVMSLGARESAPIAVRAGIRLILGTVQPEQVASDLDAWLESLQPRSSPHLIRGRLSPAARRGRALFLSPTTGCADCHAVGLFTDLGAYDVGTGRATEDPNTAFDTPTLIELWRTAPYLHDGSAPTLQDVLVTRNRDDRHGVTSTLSRAQIDDLVLYLLSL